MQKQLQLTALTAMIIFSSCCTIVNGSRQQLSIASIPTEAKVTIDGQNLGNTPFIANLARKNNHTIKIELDGYLPYEVSLARRVDGWIAGNIIFGGLIGIAVDAITGSMYKLSPADINAALTKGNASVTKTNSGIYCLVVLQPGGNWQKIGGLAKNNP